MVDPGKSPEGVRAWRFDGLPRHVTDARLAAASFVAELAGRRAPANPDAPDDVVLVVAELVVNCVCWAPGPFTLTLRDTGEGVHIEVGDTSHDPPRPTPMDMTGRGGVGWYVINALAEEAVVVDEPFGKTVHVFLPW
ncbi:ATP-binding protein [Streptomyces sp. GC420]|uniref:ATP-binding protein n=1 Tax=Streptomyces sp. GC420 TaxID=2697568 RepID=UPI001414F37D|nr:ATP-binding protein [Streptomyces sp. GC420]NBM19127.1 ATP-binding protein [Streptomyces sp. GC420]